MSSDFFGTGIAVLSTGASIPFSSNDAPEILKLFVKKKLSLLIQFYRNI
jgi:hypothetical protein